jgi:hypothetical protein
MRIKILRQTSIAGRPVRPGDVIEPSAMDARILLSMGKAELVLDPPSEAEPLPAPQAPRKPRTRKG